MRTVSRAVFAVLMLALVACTALFFMASAHAQVTDKPVLKMPTSPGVMALDINVPAAKACAVWWARDENRYGDWHLVKTFCEGEKCAGLTTDIPAMLKARTRNVTRADVAACMAKLPPPPAPAWTVAPPSAGALRVAYILNADGTRGATAGSVPLTVSGNGKTVANRCDCERRSKDAPLWSGVARSDYSYCTPAWFAPPSTEAKPIPPRVVTLCRMTG